MKNKYAVWTNHILRLAHTAYLFFIQLIGKELTQHLLFQALTPLNRTSVGKVIGLFIRWYVFFLHITHKQTRKHRRGQTNQPALSESTPLAYCLIILAVWLRVPLLTRSSNNPGPDEGKANR